MSRLEAGGACEDPHKVLVYARRIAEVHARQVVKEVRFTELAPADHTFSTLVLTIEVEGYKNPKQSC